MRRAPFLYEAALTQARDLQVLVNARITEALALLRLENSNNVSRRRVSQLVQQQRTLRKASAVILNAIDEPNMQTRRKIK